MINVFKRELIANWKSLLFWCIGMAAMAGIGFGEYFVVKQSDAALMNIIDVFPRILKVMMGFGGLPLDTPEGYLACMFLFLAIIAFLHAALTGASIISKEERDKTAEFLFSKPIKRSSVISGKILAALLNTAVVAIVAWGTTCVAWLPQLDDKSIFTDVSLLMLGMFIAQTVFLSIGVFMSSTFKDHKKSSIYASATVLGTYFLSVIIDVIGKIDFLKFLTPFKYFDPVVIMQTGYEVVYIVFSFIIIAVTVYLTYLFYGKRDLRN